MDYKFLTIEQIMDVLPNHSKIALWVNGDFTCIFWNDNKIMRKFVLAIKGDVVRLECVVDEDESPYYRVDITTDGCTSSYE